MSNKNGITEFLTLLVEFGGVHYVDDNGFICRASDNTHEQININKKGVEMVVFSQEMVAGDYTIFNPLIEPIGPSAERNWFFNRNSMIIGTMVKAMIRRCAEVAQNAEKSYDKLTLIEPYFKALDKKFLTELDKVKASDLVRIFYHKKSKTAQLQTEVFDDDFFKSLSKSFRKRSRDAIRGLITEFFRSDDISSDFKHKATHVAFQQADACIHVLVKAAECLEEYASLLLDKDLKAAELMFHLEKIEKYHKECVWFSNPTTKENVEIKERAPWESKLIESKPLPGTVSQLPVGARSAADAAYQIPSMMGGMTPNQMTSSPGYSQPQMNRSTTGLPLNAHAPGTIPHNQFHAPMVSGPPMMGNMGMMGQSPYSPQVSGPSYTNDRLKLKNLAPRTSGDASRLPAPKI